MKLITCPAMAAMMYVTITATKVDSRRIIPTPSIHSSTVPTEVWISSCAVVEEDVPVCQDPEETDEILFLITSRTRRTPYPDAGFGGDSIITTRDRMPGGDRRFVKDDRSGTANSDTRMRLWSWWKYNGGPKQKRPERPAAQETTPQATVHRDESSWRKTVIAYSLRGCSPTKMPFNLSPCSAHGAGQSILPATEAEEDPVFTSTRVVYYVPPPSTRQ